MVCTLRFFISLQNTVCFIILKYLIPVLFTFYIQCVLKLKKKNSGAIRLNDYEMHGATLKTGNKDLKNYAASWNRLKSMVCFRDESEALRRFRIRVTRSWHGARS